MTKRAYSLLPEFPIYIDRPTDDRLERDCERLMNRADSLLLSGKVTQNEYDDWTHDLDEWLRSVL